MTASKDVHKRVPYFEGNVNVKRIKVYRHAKYLSAKGADLTADLKCIPQIPGTLWQNRFDKRIS